MIIRFSIYRNKLIERRIIITDKNRFEMRFLLEKEYLDLSEKLKRYKKRGIIKTTSRKARVYDFKYKNKIKGMLYSKYTIGNAIELIKSPKSLYSFVYTKNYDK